MKTPHRIGCGCAVCRGEIRGIAGADTIPFNGIRPTYTVAPEMEPRDPTNEEIAMVLSYLERAEEIGRVSHARQLFDSLSTAQIMEKTMLGFASAVPTVEGAPRVKKPGPIDWDRIALEAMTAADAWGRLLDKRHASKATISHAGSIARRIIGNNARMGQETTSEIFALELEQLRMMQGAD